MSESLRKGDPQKTPDSKNGANKDAGDSNGKKDKIPPHMLEPLEWDQGWQRTPADQRRESNFAHEFSISKDTLFRELELFGAHNIIASSNIRIGKSGQALTGMRGARISDPGVCVTFDWRGESFSLCLDTWTKVADNIHALSTTIGYFKRILQSTDDSFVLNLLRNQGQSRENSASSAPSSEESSKLNEPIEDVEDVEHVDVEVVRLKPQSPHKANWWETLKIPRESTMDEVFSAHEKLRLTAAQRRDSEALYKIDEALMYAKQEIEG